MENPKDMIQTLELLTSLMRTVENDKEVEVVVKRDLLERATEMIALLVQREEMWKSIADDFAQSVTVTQGNGKPRFNVDLEKFMSAQYQYQNTTNDLQQTL
jgi:hypothetical protein